MADSVPSMHEPLKEDQIRLLHLQPGQHSGPLQCRLTTIPLAGPLRYEALSYVCGPNEPAAYITCNHDLVQIRPNLASALKQFRHPDQSRLLWCDQISINQDDISERSAQVNMMGEIFKRAERVLMYLGPDDEVEPKALMAKDLIMRLAVLEDETPFRYDAPTDEAVEDCDLPPLDSPAWEALAAFISLPYFTRVWIFQEFKLNPHRLPLWGSTRISVKVLQHAINFMHANPMLLLDRRNPLSGKSLLLVKSLFDRADSLFDMLHVSHAREASDMRDKVFATLSMLEYVPEYLKADYSKSLAEVLTSAARYWLEEQGKLIFLCHAGIDLDRETKDEIGDWPSWVPLWQAGRGVSIDEHILHCTADAKEQRDARQDCSNPNVLSIAGVSLGEVLHVCGTDLGPWPQSVESCGRNAYDAYELYSAHLDLPKTESTVSTIENFVRLFICGSYDGLPDDWLYIDFATFWSEYILFATGGGLFRTFKDFRDSLQPALAALAAVEDPNVICRACNDDSPRSEEYAFKDTYWKELELERPRGELADHVNKVKTVFSGMFRDPDALDRAVKMIVPLCYYTGSEDRFIANYLKVAWRTRMFITPSGAVGMGPHHMQADDAVAILFGAPVPFLLRPAEREGEHLLVGACHIDGVMQGEHVDGLRKAGRLEEAKSMFRIA